MLLEVLGRVNSPRVLSAVGNLGASARFTDIRNAAGLGDAQVSRALKDLNKRGLVAGRPASDRSMRYSITKAGGEVLALIRDFHEFVHGRHGPVAQAADREFEEILAA